ncbi:MAG: glutamate racemase [Oscillospiraceae bacterium]
MTNNKPIGVFDSGLGGLTVVKQLMDIMPNEDIVYFGDTGRVPYGTRSRETIQKYADQDIRFLRTMDVKMIIAACGTASAVISDEYRKKLDLPYTGVVLPAAQAAASVSATGNIGVIGTTATVRSGAYGKAIRTIRHDARVIGSDCPLFVPLVENGWFEEDNQVARLVAEQYLAPFMDGQVDTLILGCTHYPLLRAVIEKVLGSKVRLIDPGAETARFTAAKLMQDGMTADSGKTGRARFFVSDTTEGFSQNAGRFLHADVSADVERIDIERIAESV